MKYPNIIGREAGGAEGSGTCALKKTGFTLGADVRWVEAEQECYIKK